MATATSKAASLTTLKIGTVEVPVGLFSTVAKPGKTPEGFTTAGPNGGELKARAVARPVPVDEVPVDTPDAPVSSDPLAVEELNAARVEGAPDPQTAAREALAAEAEGDARSRGIGELGGSNGGGSLVGWDAGEASASASWSAPADVAGEYGRELIEDGSGDVVLPQDVRRGVRLEDGRFIDCTEQLAEIDERTKLDKMEVVGFVDGTHVPRTRVKGCYYVGAGDEKAPRALRVLFEGLKAKRRMALVKLTKKSRQSLGVIGSAGGVLVLIELVWAEDCRAAPARVTRIQKEQISAGELEAVCALIDAMACSPIAVDEFRDDAIALREELYAKAIAGEVPETLVPPRPTPEQDVMAQLEASLAAVSA